jgi:hypothetical protein
MCDRVGKADREFIDSLVERARDVSDLLLHFAGVHVTARIVISKP